MAGTLSAEPGDRVEVVGFPKGSPWMAGLLWSTGRLEEFHDRGEGRPRSVRVSGVLDEDFWIAEVHLRPARDEEGAPGSEGFVLSGREVQDG